MRNPRSDRVRQVRALAGRSVRQRTGRFLVEGPQAVREAVQHAPGRVQDVYLTAAAADRYPEIARGAGDAGLHVHEASDEVLTAMSADAQGVLAVAETWSTSLSDLVDRPSGARGPRLVAVLSSVRDPGNAGTVIRAADAAGADAVVLTTGSVEPFNPKVVRSTAGSLFHLPVVTGVPVEEAVSTLGAAGLVVLAADGGGARDLDELADAAASRRTGTGTGTAVDLAAPTAWLFGTEAQGLSDAERGLAAATVRVPIRGLAESLNLATAATLCLYASSRAQR
ncbi:TrmH family RNA methyltransferase [Luteimicrobium subarcticum]|uniref:TrmH family RNA methyltransferase n=1 Tax=Luteimicrobium subarcticum TaxID=620910 RepID=UPI000C2502D4|nr:RNA methyltransferase [Luteimicrobium subarcticum]